MKPRAVEDRSTYPVRGWAPVKNGNPVTQYLYGPPQALVHFTKCAAWMEARFVAQRQDEMESGDPNRWENSEMPIKRVRELGYSVVAVFVQRVTRKSK